MQTTAHAPILHVYHSSGESMNATVFPVELIDFNFYENPAFTEVVVDGLIREGRYDESDGGDTISLFFTDRPEDVRRQWVELVRRWPDIPSRIIGMNLPDDLRVADVTPESPFSLTEEA